MKVVKVILLASFAVLPFAVAAHAADVDPAPPIAAEESEAMGLYLRGDLGWSFLEWSGGSDDSAVSFGGGVGYQFNDNMRADVTVDWAGDYDVAPGADMSTTTVLGNLYFDWANDSAFTPYVGAGLGYGWVDDTPTGDDSGIAYGLTAGVAMDLTDNIALDLGYRFRETIISGSDPMEHQIAAGVRFSF
ncbi:MAG TPA: porin family protein [Aestuariivirga sp.]|jgi:opacity protein-like surface antigen|nr:porin family protein [Aestuariivirga sp.]